MLDGMYIVMFSSLVVYDDCPHITKTYNFFSSLLFSKLPTTYIRHVFFKKSKPTQPLNHNTRDTLENIATLKSAHSKAKFARQAKINPPTSSASFTAVSKTQWAKDVKKKIAQS